MHNAKPLLLLALLTATSTISAGGLWTVNAPSDGFLSLRSEPSITNGTRLAKIPHGTTLKKGKCQKLLNLEGDSGHWCKAEYSGKTGWIFDAYLMASSTRAPIAAAPAPAPTTQSSARSTPTINVGDTVYIYDNQYYKKASVEDVRGNRIHISIAGNCWRTSWTLMDGKNGAGVYCKNEDTPGASYTIGRYYWVDAGDLRNSVPQL